MAIDQEVVLLHLKRVFPDQIIHQEKYTIKTVGAACFGLVRSLAKADGISAAQWLQSKGFTWRESCLDELDSKDQHTALTSNVYFEKTLRENQFSFLGQIQVSDNDYTQLIEFSREKIRSLQSRSIIPADLCLSVTMVQIAIRRYREGRYWPCFLEEIGLELPASKLNYLGQIFAKTLSEYRLFSIPQEQGTVNQYVENIKAHAFVTDWYLDGFFEFSYAFFENNLMRDLTEDIGEDLDDLSSFMRTTLTSDRDTISESEDAKKTAKSYRLLRSTRAAFAYAERAALRAQFLPILQMIDRYYYDGEISNLDEDRFARAFATWIERQDTRDRGNARNEGRKRRVANRRPFISVDPKVERAVLVVPPQKFRNEDCDGRASVSITINGITHTRELSLYRSFGTFVSEKTEIAITDIFEEILIQISALSEREYRIAKSSYRVFDSAWSNNSKPTLGHNYLLARHGVLVSWRNEEDIIERSAAYRDWQYFSIQVNDESVFYIGNRPLSLMGEFSLDPVFEQEINSFTLQNDSGKRITATRAHPVISFVVEKNRLHGTALLVNGKPVFVEKIREKTSFEWPQDKKQVAVSIHTDTLFPQEDGYYQIYLDIPARENRCVCNYYLLRNFRCRFDKRKYTYDKEMVLEISTGNHEITVPEDWSCAERSSDTAVYRIPTKQKTGELLMYLDDCYQVVLPVKVFQYGFSLAEMRCDKPEYLWYKDIGETLYVSIPGATEVCAYWGKESEKCFAGVKLEDNTFRIDISEIKRRIVEEGRRHWQYINLFYTDNSKRRMALPAILRSTEVRPYFKLGYDLNTIYLDTEEILGDANIFLDVREKSSGKIVVSGKRITVGRTALPELSKAVLYDLLPYLEETDEFGFSTEIVRMKPLLGVSVEDWNDLTDCRVAVSSILFEGEALASDYDYYVSITERDSEGRYFGTMFGRKLAASGKDRYERDKNGKYIHIKYGKVTAVVDIQGNEMLMSLQMYSGFDKDWMAPFYDAKRKMLLHCDDPLLDQHDPTGTRFVLLDEYETVLMINTERINRIGGSAQAV